MDPYESTRYDGAVMLLPPELRRRARILDGERRKRAEELRLRVGRALGVVLPEGEISLGEECVTREELEAVMEIVTRASMHSVGDSIRRGYVTARGGYRLGLCGTAITERGEITGIRNLSSLSLRIPRELRGVGEAVLRETVRNGAFASTLILSPPGVGKTTLLRDMVRLLSDRYRFRVSVCDERGEIAAVWEGKNGLDVGKKTDVMNACPKGAGSMAMVRAMNPQILAMDEVTSPEDVEALETAAYCGVSLLATAHGAGQAEMRKRPLYDRMMGLGVFRYVVTISTEKGTRHYRVREAEGC